jgi:pyridoxal phosphate enzyme (YggS family)
MNIGKRILEIKENLPPQTQLVAVSKTHSIDKIEEAYHAGQRIFGENKVQELVAKHEQLPKDIQWHYIGHLQTNKIKFIAPFISLIHGVDSIKLLQTIHREGEKINRVVPCLLQFHIATEETKFGFDPDEIETIIQALKNTQHNYAQVVGVMGMGSNTENNLQTQTEFLNLAEIYKRLNFELYPNSTTFKEISMGMSDDYKLAIAAGSTLVRIGSSIFGDRYYE